MSDFAYVARKACGCIVGTALIGSLEDKDLGAVTGKWIAAGFALDRVILDGCDHNGLDTCTNHRRGAQATLPFEAPKADTTEPEKESEDEGAETCGVPVDAPRIDVGPGTPTAGLPGMDVRESPFLVTGFGAIVRSNLGTKPFYVSLMAGDYRDSGQKFICPECMFVDTAGTTETVCDECNRDMLPLVDRASALTWSPGSMAVPKLDPDFLGDALTAEGDGEDDE